MIITISGSTGFIGQALRKKIRAKEWEIRIIDRNSLALPDAEFGKKMIEGSDVVINLAGAPVAERWTESHRKLIRESRINTTRKITKSILSAVHKPSLFISQSSIGIYDSLHIHKESSSDFADDFLATLCREWENEALAAQSVTRIAIFRTGLVLGRDGGFLEKLYLPFSIGLGGRVGDGKQSMSFIHIDDLVNAYLFVIEHPELSGIINAVSPFPTTNEEFTDKFGKVLKQPTWLPIPTVILRIRLGEASKILLEGQKVLPEKLEKAGFRFLYPTVQNALVKIFG